MEKGPFVILYVSIKRFFDSTAKSSYMRTHECITCLQALLCIFPCTYFCLVV